MRESILEMQKNLNDGLYIAFTSADDEHCYSLTKNDEIKFINEKTIMIRRKSGWHTIINLNWIADISIKRGLM